MSKTGKFSAHLVPDLGVWYTPGEMVRIDHSGREARLVKDVNGDHEVHSCRHATEFKGDPALLRVGLRKPSPTDRADPPSPARYVG